MLKFTQEPIIGTVLNTLSNTKGTSSREFILSGKVDEEKRIKLVSYESSIQPSIRGIEVDNSAYTKIESLGIDKNILNDLIIKISNFLSIENKAHRIVITKNEKEEIIIKIILSGKKLGDIMDSMQTISTFVPEVLSKIDNESTRNLLQLKIFPEIIDLQNGISI